MKASSLSQPRRLVQKPVFSKEFGFTMRDAQFFNEDEWNALARLRDSCGSDDIVCVQNAMKEIRDVSANGMQLLDAISYKMKRLVNIVGAIDDGAGTLESEADEGEMLHLQNHL